MGNVTYKVRLVRVDMPDERLERSRFLQEANIKYLDLVGREKYDMFCFPNFSYQPGVRAPGTGKTYGAPYGADQ